MYLQIKNHIDLFCILNTPISLILCLHYYYACPVYTLAVNLAAVVLLIFSLQLGNN